LFHLGVRGSYAEYMANDYGSYFLMIVVNSFTLLLLSSGLYIYGLKLKNKLVNNNMWTPQEKKKKLNILVRINSVMAVCCLCFLLRVICLIGVFSDAIRHETLTDTLTNTEWFVVSNFIPTIGPVSTHLQHIMVMYTYFSILFLGSYLIVYYEKN
jgi:uncharacterized iron-regulated membrane protein